jgi:pimeloyl-ACP methyl ester carboxylesterase
MPTDPTLVCVSKTVVNRVTGQPIAYSASSGKRRPAVVLLHGFGGSKENWRVYGYRAALLAAGYRTIAIDSLGHGDSGRPADPWMYLREHRAGDVVAVLDAEGISRAHAIGYSMGGWWVSALAKYCPERLLSVGIGGMDPERGGEQDRGNWQVRFARMRKQGRVLSDEGIASFKAATEALTDFEGSEAALSALSVPVAMWAGTALSSSRLAPVAFSYSPYSAPNCSIA